MRVFVAGSSEDMVAVREVMKAVEAEGHTVFDWTTMTITVDPENTCLGALFFSDLLVCVNTVSCSAGASYELGYWDGSGNPRHQRDTAFVLHWNCPPDVIQKRIYLRFYEQGNSLTDLREWLKKKSVDNE